MLTLIFAIGLPIWLLVEELLRIRAKRSADAGTRIVVPVDRAMPVTRRRGRMPVREPVSASTI